MHSYKTISAEVDVYVSDVLEQIDDDELIEEVESRGLNVNPNTYVSGDTVKDLLYSIWMKRRLSKDFDQDLDQLIYLGIGKLI